MKKVILILLVGLSLSCSDKLTRSEAKKQIATKNREMLCKFDVQKSWRSHYRSSGFCSVIITNPPSDREIEKINYFIRKGLLELNRETIYKDCAEWKLNTLSVTPKGAPFLVAEKDNKLYLRSAKFSIDQVTGIQQKENALTATVEYKVKKIESTPFADFWDINCYDENDILKAYFTKYDDGWRINYD